jgi:hypothetical protein
VTATTGAAPANTATTFTDGFTLNGNFMPLSQFHFHSPSEHTIGGVHYPLEMHMVHKRYINATTGAQVAGSSTGAAVPGTNMSAAVIGIMFKLSCVPTLPPSLRVRALTCARARTPRADIAHRLSARAPRRPQR